MLITKTTSYLLPFQYGVGIKGGAASSTSNNFSILEIDFKNTFNMIHRERILSTIAGSFQQGYPYVFQAYGSPSCLAYGENCIFSQRGVQQGDRLGPLLFSIII